MAKVKVKKGTKLVCVACAREVMVSNWGISRTTLWCCKRPMQNKPAAKRKAAKRK